MQNIGVTFIKTGQYSDAISSFEHIMSTSPNLKAGFNLILSYFAIGDQEKMKKSFQKLIAVPLEIDEDDKYISPSVSMTVQRGPVALSALLFCFQRALQHVTSHVSSRPVFPY